MDVCTYQHDESLKTVNRHLFNHRGREALRRRCTGHAVHGAVDVVIEAKQRDKREKGIHARFGTGRAGGLNRTVRKVQCFAKNSPTNDRKDKVLKR